ncbi:hypothetical protein HPB52_008760 [Rhipicephalus sanguineus]|uniref:Schlafen AlbA-2 domain-containing protein n=1 Tax=Rhipicephalus sanguineus TaxID=34632 RepID=A0A9D4T7L5_RHISA|nr:hypothetical protein HPB52_008760 [Rhipicephalus sanguineus]
MIGEHGTKLLQQRALLFCVGVWRSDSWEQSVQLPWTPLLPVSGASCTSDRLGEHVGESNPNDGEEVQANAQINVEARGEVAPANIETDAEDVPAVQPRDSRRSGSQAHSSSEDSCSDESSSTFNEEALRAEDHQRPSLRIADVGVFPDKASGAVPKRSAEIQQWTTQRTPKFETIYEMTRKFVHNFTTLHVEREYDIHDVYVCVACSSAQRMLVQIREAITEDQEGRRVALDNATFMNVLVQLCNLDSSHVPRICAVGSREIRTYYQTASCCKIVGTVTLLEDEHSEQLWKRFFGAAANKISTKTYTVKVQGNPRTDGGGYGDVDAFLEQATKRSQLAVDWTGDPPAEADSLIIADCLDARHVMVYDSLKAKEDAAALDVSIAQFHQLSLNRETLREPPNVGDIVGLVVAKDCVQRVLVVKVIEDIGVVWSIDHGRFHKVQWCDLINVAPSLWSLPPAVALAVLQDVEAAPYAKLLRECVRTLRAVTNHDTNEETFHVFMLTKVTTFGVLDVLSDLLHCPDYVTRMTAAECLIKICCRHNGRQAVAKAACVPQALLRLDDLTRSEVDDDSSVAMVTEEMRALFNLLQAMFFCNEQLRLECAETDLLAIVVRAHKSLPPTDTIRQDAERCIRAILGVPPIRRTAEQQKLKRQRKQQQQAQPRDCNRQELHGGYRQDPGTSSDACCPTQRVYKRETAAPAQVRLVTMTPEKVKIATALSCYPKSEALQPMDAAAASSLMPTQIPKPMADVPPSSACTGGAAAAAPRGRFYIRGMLVPLRSDGTREVRPVERIKKASARTLANIACSFLNTWKPCSIYYGISPEGFVRGVMLNQKERDDLRCGVDFTVGNLRPHLTSTSFGVEYVPVLRHAADKPEEAHHFVVEVWVRGVHGIVYTTSDGDCYLREGGVSYQAGTHDVRAWIARVEEKYYLQANNTASLKEGALPAAGDAPWHDAAV